MIHLLSMADGQERVSAKLHILSNTGLRIGVTMNLCHLGRGYGLFPFINRSAVFNTRIIRPASLRVLFISLALFCFPANVLALDAPIHAIHEEMRRKVVLQRYYEEMALTIACSLYITLGAHPPTLSTNNIFSGKWVHSLAVLYALTLQHKRHVRVDEHIWGASNYSNVTHIAFLLCNSEEQKLQTHHTINYLKYDSYVW